MNILNTNLQSFETETRRKDLSDLEFRCLCLLANNESWSVSELSNILKTSFSSTMRLIYFLRAKTKLKIKTLRGWKSYRLEESIYIK